MSILDALPHRCRRLIRTRTQDDYGGAYDSFARVGGILTCWRQAAGDSEISQFAKRGVTVTDKVYFTADPQVDERHILEMVTLDEIDPAIVTAGHWYEVRSFAEPDATVGRGIAWRVMAERTTVGTTTVPWGANP